MIDLIDREKLIEAVKAADTYELFGHRVHGENSIIELITKSPCETGMTVQRLCEKCVHHKVCIVYLKGEPDELIRLSHCAFFLEGEQNE